MAVAQVPILQKQRFYTHQNCLQTRKWLLGVTVHLPAMPPAFHATNENNTGRRYIMLTMRERAQALLDKPEQDNINPKAQISAAFFAVENEHYATALGFLQQALGEVDLLFAQQQD